MSFVANDEVPVGIGQFRLNVLIAAELIQATDSHRIFSEPVSRTGRFELVVRQDFERKLEPLIEFVLPLLGKIPGTDDHAAVEIPADQQFLNKEAGHNRLSGAGI